MWQKFLNNLKSPFPFNSEGKTYLYFPPMVILILMMFHPFGLGNIEPVYLKYIVEFGYGIVTLLILLLNTKLFPKLFPNLFQEQKWTVLNEIMLTLLIVVTISAGNAIYTHLLGFTRLNFITAIVFVFYTILVATFPIIVSIFVRKNHYLKQNLFDATVINNSISDNKPQKPIEELLKFQGQSENEYLEVKAEDILYIQSQRNYVQFFYRKNNTITNKLIRSTMKEVEESIDNYQFLKRCHRSFIININIIQKVEGDSLGLSLLLKDLDIIIPVSRSCVKDLKNIINI